MKPVRGADLRDHGVGALLALAYLCALYTTAGDLALSRDESFYLHAAERYGGWYELLWREGGEALSRRAIDRAWEYNHEHPALLKTLFAWSWLLEKHTGIFGSTTQAVRFPAMVLAGLWLWLTYIWGVRAKGRVVGLGAAVFLALLPRVFYHAHLSCFDVPIAFMLTWVSYAYWRALDQPRWLIWVGVAYGAALATKHNAWILPGVLLVHWLWVRFSTPAAALPPVARGPVWLGVLFGLGVPLFLASWPWLWFDTWARWKWYAAFHLEHVHYSIQYLGTTYFRPPFPASYAWVMLLFTVPFVTVLLGACGLVVSRRDVVPPFLARRGWPGHSPDGRHTEVLWVGGFLAPLVVFMVPTTPIFGGTKHWFAAYPFLALFAGVALDRLVDVVGATVERWGRPPRRAAVVLVAATMVLPPFVETAHSHPFGLSHYTPLAGGVPGAADLGMNRQFWGFTHGSLADWFREAMPKGGTVWLCDATTESWRALVRDGRVPKGIRPAANLVSADYAIVHHEEHFNEVDYQIWEAFGTATPVHVLTYDGVPIVSVYRNAKR